MPTLHHCSGEVPADEGEVPEPPTEEEIIREESSTANYTCSDGYQQSGLLTSTCTSTGLEYSYLYRLV